MNLKILWTFKRFKCAYTGWSSKEISILSSVTFLQSKVSESEDRVNLTF